MGIINLKNEIADQFSYAQLPKLEELIKPLSSFDITHFSYNKFVGKDKFMILSPILPWIRENFGRSLDQEFIVQSMLNYIHQEKGPLLWQPSTSYNPLLEGLRVLNFKYGISFSQKKGDDVYEVFHFATTNDNEQIIDFYLRNFSVLNVFSDYFVDKMSDIIDHQLPGKLIQIDKKM